MIKVAAAVIINSDGQVFLSSRPSDKPPAGWEFPGGKLESGESAFDAVKRELREELAWEITPVKDLYTLTTENIVLYFILCTPAADSSPAACENQQFKWVDISLEIPDGLLKNDTEFWNFLVTNKINCQIPAL